MATVWLARDLKHDRGVAIKVLRPEVAQALGPDRFLREIELTARLTHPHILPLLDSGTAPGLLYYVMPYVEGESLRDRLDREKQLPLEDALQIAREVADALSYAHSHDVIHRDIKPENILLESGHAVVADFGIARAITAAGGQRLTETGIAVGTPAYMSPEQAGGARELDGRSDVYSLGCVLYEMLSGQPPFTGPSAQAVLARQTLDPVPPLRTVRNTVPEALEDAVMRALAKVPADRFATAAAFGTALGAPLTSHDARMRAHRRAGSRRRLWTAATVGSLALGLTAWLALSGDGPAPSSTSPTRVAVFPFTVQDPSLAYLREGLMDLVSLAIDGAGSVGRVDPNALMSRLRAAGETETPDLGVARQTARDLGAGRFVLGRAVPAGPAVRVVVSLYTAEDALEPEYSFQQERALDSLSDLVGALARELLMHIPGALGTDAKGPITSSYAAVHAYARGEAFMRRSAFDSAAAAFQQAVAADSAFALAWLRLSVAQDLRAEDAAMIAAIDQANRYRERLAPRHRMLTEVIHAYTHGDGRRGEEVGLELVSANPGYAEAWYNLGNTQFNYAWQRGRSPLQAEVALERALALDPDSRPVQVVMGWAAALDRREARRDSFITRAWGEPWPMLPKDPARQSAFLARTERLSTPGLIWTTLVNASYGDRLAGTAELARQVTDSTRRPEHVRSVGHLLRAYVEAARGRWASADSAFADAARDDGVGVIERGWLAALPFLRVEEARRRTIRDSLLRWEIPARYLARPRSPELYSRVGLLLLPPWLVPHARVYVLGLLSASLSDSGVAVRHATTLEKARAHSDSIGLLRDLALEIRALLAMQQRDTVVALAILDSAGMRVASAYQFWDSPFHMRPLTRFLKGEAAASLGRPREALGWYAGLFWSEFDHVFVAPASIRMGEVLDQLGDPSKAREHYARFVARWSDADPIHQPLLAEVRRRLDRREGRQRSAREQPATSGSQSHYRWSGLNGRRGDVPVTRQSDTGT